MATDTNIALDKVSAFEQLEGLTSDMDIPEYQKTKASWLVKNLPKFHSTHPNFPQAFQLAKTILAKGWS